MRMFVIGASGHIGSAVLAESLDTDRRAIEAIGAALAGSGKPFVSTTASLRCRSSAASPTVLPPKRTCCRAVRAWTVNV
jgi:hypothetical protein